MKYNKTGFSNPIFTTDYSFQSPRALIRIISDAFSRQHCDYEYAKVYASEKTKGRCLYCGKALYNLEKYSKTSVVEYSNQIHYDHIYPAIFLNLFEVGNVALSCETCNLEKSSRQPMEYYDMRKAEYLPLLIDERSEFESFLTKLTKPYRDKWPKQFEIQNLDLSDEEFKFRMVELLNDVDISSMSSRYNHEFSINKEFWSKVVSKGCESYSKFTAKDIEARIGYTNEFFEDTFGSTKRIEDCTVTELAQFTNALLSSKYESKNEIQKFRMLIKMLVEVLNEGMIEGQFDGFYDSVPTYSKIKVQKNS